MNAQNKTLIQPTPKSPNAASFDSYTDVPVSLSTGLLNFSIPLYEIRAGSIKIPITLNYHNNGLRPGEISSWVGYGWSLFCGGQISYQQRGENDFHATKGMFNGGKTQLDSFFADQMNPTQKQFYFEDIIAGNIDSEYDLFYYTLPTENGSFYFTSATEARLNPLTDIHVEKTTNGFKMVDDGGNAYFFESQEPISQYNLSTDALTGDFDDNSTYYLTKIIAINGDSVSFKYRSYSFQYTKTIKYIDHAGYATTMDCPDAGVSANDILTTATYLLPDSIVFREGYVRFAHSQNLRQDIIKIDTNSNVPYLDSLIIYNFNNKEIKAFTFHQSNFGGDEKLRLDSINEGSTSAAGRHWAFSYYGQTAGFPSFFSTAEDHWGFANANTANTGIPDANYSNFIYNWTTNYSVQYADKSSDSSSAIKGLLQKVVYPTGGTSEFEYEANKFKLGAYADFDFGNYLKIPTSSFTNLIASASEITGGTDTGSFTISESGYYKISSLKQLSPDPFYDNADITFTGPSSTDLYNITNQCGPTQCVTSNEIIYLLQGNYLYTAKGSFYESGGNTIYLSASFSLHSSSTPVYYPVGGFRISKTIHVDSVANSRITKKYVYNDTVTNISFKQIPEYVTSVAMYYDVSTFCLSCGGNHYTVHDRSVQPMVGNVIEYSLVSELTDLNGLAGKTDYAFLLSSNIGGSLSEPIPVPTNTSWMVGRLSSLKTYDGDNTLKAMATMDYSTDSSSYVNGLKVGYEIYCLLSSGRTYRTNLATAFSQSFKNTSSVNTIYEDGSDLSIGENYYYNLSRHNSTDSIVRSTSENSLAIKKTIYVKDYDNLNAASDPEANALKALKEVQINQPVEEIQIKEKSGVKYIVGGTLKLFKEPQKVIDKIYKLVVDTPINISNFTFSYVSSGGEFFYDSRYKLSVSFNSYDSYQNILDQNLRNNHNISYIWGYRTLYPVAEVVNSPVSDISYTSFEADDKGGWNFSGPATSDPSAPTGEKGYSLPGGDITKSGLQTGTTYVITYWKKENTGTVTVNTGNGTSLTTKNGWTLYEHQVTGSTGITITGSAYIDELRLHPRGALMTTYTYSPLVGMTTRADANNHITYYEYDGLSRLAIIKDQDKKVLKKICYNYAGQEEDCSSGYYSNVAKSDTFTKNDCDSNYIGASVIYTVPAGTYSSKVSQVYVDSLAQADVDTNGQAYANANGTCDCDSTTCTGPTKICLYNACEYADLKCVSSVFNSKTGLWTCTYYYVFSYSCSSTLAYIIQSPTSCPVDPPCH